MRTTPECSDRARFFWPSANRVRNTRVGAKTGVKRMRKIEEKNKTIIRRIVECENKKRPAARREANTGGAYKQYSYFIFSDALLHAVVYYIRKPKVLRARPARIL